MTPLHHFVIGLCFLLMILVYPLRPCYRLALHACDRCYLGARTLSLDYLCEPPFATLVLSKSHPLLFLLPACTVTLSWNALVPIHNEKPKQAFGNVFIILERAFVLIHDEKSKRSVGTYLS